MYEVFPLVIGGNKINQFSSPIDALCSNTMFILFKLKARNKSSDFVSEFYTRRNVNIQIMCRCLLMNQNIHEQS